MLIFILILLGGGLMSPYYLDYYYYSITNGNMSPKYHKEINSVLKKIFFTYVLNMTLNFFFPITLH